MNSERTLIAAVVFLAVGLSLLFGYTQGTVNFSAAYPVSGASFQAAIKTTGMPAMAGFPATVVGAILLVVALVQAIIGQVRVTHETPKRESRSVP
jgi:TRAP-type C4-dicarboxylate transport system permease small subunit